MNEMAKRSGGSKATLHGYFPSKEALFVAVVRACSTGHLSEAVEELRKEAKSDTSLHAELTRFGERMPKVLTNDGAALAVYRMAVAEAVHSDVGQLFNESGPRESMVAPAHRLTRAMEAGELRTTDPAVSALQFTALVTAETSGRLFERNPVPLSLAQIRTMVSRAVELFMSGMQPTSRR